MFKIELNLLLFYTFQHGIDYFIHFAIDGLISHSLLHLLLLLVIIWIYGRERFQRDVEFMLGQPLASWKMYMLRFIAPIFLMICIVCLKL